MPSEQDQMLVRLANSVNQKKYGKYRGIVTDNVDSESRGRLKVKVPAIWGEDVEHWALPCMPFGGLTNQGMFMLPEISAQVWVEFEAGDPEFPIWTGTFWQTQSDVPEDIKQDNGPTTRAIVTPAGHKIILEDKDGEEFIKLHHKEESNLEFASTGNIILTDSSSNTVTLDAENNQLIVEDANGNTLSLTSSGTTVEDSNGNKIEMAASGINVKGAQIVVEGETVTLGGSFGEPIIKGQSFLTLFATHVHGSAMGPTSPPVPQGEMSTLSTKVMTG